MSCINVLLSTNWFKSTIHLVNRLDKETSGYMLVAKTSQAHALLSKDIKQVERVYHCLVEGILEGEGVIDRPILKVMILLKELLMIMVSMLRRIINL